MELIIIGNNSYSLMMKKYIESTTEDRIVAFSVEEKYVGIGELDGALVVPLHVLIHDYPPDRYKLIMGIGYREMGEIRSRVFHMCKRMGYEFLNYIHPSAVIFPDVIFGEGNNILEGVIVEAGCTVGDANLLFAGSILGHDSMLGNFNTLSIRAATAGNVTILNNCFLGVSSAIRDGVTIKSYTLVGAAAFASKNTSEYSVLRAPYTTIDNKISTDYL